LYFVINDLNNSGNAVHYGQLGGVNVNTGEYRDLGSVENGMGFGLIQDERYILYTVGIRLYPGGHTYLVYVNLRTGEETKVDPDIGEKWTSKYIDFIDWKDNNIKFTVEYYQTEDNGNKKIQLWQYNVETKEYKLIK